MSAENTRRPTLSVVPLGGLGEFGMNTMLVTAESTSIVIDAGGLFPDQSGFGVDLLVPDLTDIRDNGTRVSALVLTHGHEDHIGGVPYLWDLLDGPVYGTPMTLGLLEPKLAEYGIDPGTRLTPIAPGDTVRVDGLDVEFIHVTHNLPGCVAVAIHSSIGTVVHTGDYKFDPTPQGGRPIDSRRLGELGRAGVLALFGDSTNSDRKGVTGSEQDVTPAFEKIFARTRGKILVTTFASSLYRIQLLVDLAVKSGRKIAVVGRGLTQNTAIAERLGHLTIPPHLRVAEADVATLDPRTILCLVTGSQGEPRAALSRIATDQHRHIRLESGDVVVFSARVIPGNQRAIGALMDNATRRGAEVVHEGDSLVHVSGHASSEELKLMLSLIRPRHFVPIHGEYRCLAQHARLATTAMRGHTEVFLLENGHPLCFDAEGAWRGEPVRTGRVPIDRDGMEKVAEHVLRDRRRLALHGVVFVVIPVECVDGVHRMVRDPEVVTRGFTADAKLDAILEDLPGIVHAVVEKSQPIHPADLATIEERLRAEIQGFLRRRSGQRPLVVPVITEA